jgi:hypothetical protein
MHVTQNYTRKPEYAVCFWYCRAIYDPAENFE